MRYPLTLAVPELIPLNGICSHNATVTLNGTSGYFASYGDPYTNLVPASACTWHMSVDEPQVSFVYYLFLCFLESI